MDKKSDRQYSLLIVSAAEQFNSLVKRAIPSRSFDVIEVRKSISAAQRELLSRKYDIDLIRGYDMFPNTPHVETVVSLSRVG